MSSESSEFIKVKRPKSVKAALKALDELFSSPARWTKEAFARKSLHDANDVHELSKEAKCFCLSGGVTRVCGIARTYGRSILVKERVRAYLMKAIMKYTGDVDTEVGIIRFNDDEATTFGDLKKVIRKARKLAAKRAA
jgi:hypothetical protein